METSPKYRNEFRKLLRQNFDRERDQLLPVLHFIHHEFGYLPDWAMEVTGWHLGIPTSEVFGAATSYTELRIEPPGKHILRICTGLPCQSNGSKELLLEMEKKLGIQIGMTTPNAHITLEETACGYLCGVAPAVQIDGVWDGHANLSKTLGSLEKDNDDDS